jgi:hypothetical protein
MTGLRQLIRRFSDHQLAASRQKDPVRCIEIAYRNARRREEDLQGSGPGLLTEELKKWPIPGAYDTPGNGPLAYVYAAWQRGVSAEEFRKWLFDQPRKAVDPTMILRLPPRFPFPW